MIPLCKRTRGSARAQVSKGKYAGSFSSYPTWRRRVKVPRGALPSREPMRTGFHTTEECTGSSQLRQARGKSSAQRWSHTSPVKCSRPEQHGSPPPNAPHSLSSSEVPRNLSAAPAHCT